MHDIVCMLHVHVVTDSRAGGVHWFQAYSIKL